MLNAKSTAHSKPKRRLPEDERAFRQWASLFSGKLFVMLAAYADESETRVSAYGGYVASVDEWDQFNAQWGKILKDYKARLFHFREWAMASAVVRGNRRPHTSFNKNPYSGWSEADLNSFLLELAEVAGTRKRGAFGGFISLERFNERKAAGEILIGEDHRDYCLQKCFQAFIGVLGRQRQLSARVSFFWDGTKNVAWKNRILSAYEPFRK